MRCNSLLRHILLVWAMVIPSLAAAQHSIDIEAGITANYSDGELAPYYTMSNRYGTLTQGRSALMNVKLEHSLDSTQRFSYGYGAELWGGWASSADYARYDASSQTWSQNGQHPSRVWLQQLYGAVKYRGLSYTIGVQEHRNAMIDAALGSGDLILSGNARPMPGIRIGFVDFQDMPFTKGWVQVSGEIGIYKDAQDQWLKNHYGYYNSIITTGSYTNYKRWYFRTNPSQPVSVTVGLQSACQFFGERSWYYRGALVGKDRMKPTLKSFLTAIIPSKGNESSSLEGDANFCEGNHLGSWDLAVRYQIDAQSTLRGYWQSPMEDGSGIGKLNGWDGLYGLEYRSARRGLLTGAAVEYIDFTNQSGPIHWAPGDFPGTHITDQATGADDYYNNYF